MLKIQVLSDIMLSMGNTQKTYNLQQYLRENLKSP